MIKTTVLQSYLPVYHTEVREDLSQSSSANSVAMTRRAPQQKSRFEVHKQYNIVEGCTAIIITQLVHLLQHVSTEQRSKLDSLFTRLDENGDG